MEATAYWTSYWDRINSPTSERCSVLFSSCVYSHDPCPWNTGMCIMWFLVINPPSHFVHSSWSRKMRCLYCSSGWLQRVFTLTCCHWENTRILKLTLKMLSVYMTGTVPTWSLAYRVPSKCNYEVNWLAREQIVFVKQIFVLSMLHLVPSLG